MDRSVGLVARTDLPPDEHVDDAVTPSGAAATRRRDAVIAIGYEDEPDASQPSLLALVERLEAAAVDVVDVLVVRDGRRYSPICSEPCCPPDGLPLPDPADVPAVAEFVARGRSPLASRGAVDALVEAAPGTSRGMADAVAARPGCRVAGVGPPSPGASCCGRSTCCLRLGPGTCPGATRVVPVGRACAPAGGRR